jgi:chlorobactene glucosyltransferase
MLKVFPSLPTTAAAATWPKVSIIVPVKDEEDTIELCLDTLLNLEYSSKEIIVIEGGSEDGTGRVLQTYSDKVTVLNERALPDGWIGKNWACHLGYLRSKGELLLFTDGDTAHVPSSLKRSVKHLLTNDVDMVSIYPKLVTRSFGERLMTPLIAFLIFIYSGGNRVNDDASSRHMANGQYILTTKSTYEKVGGHAAIKNEIVEDVKMAEAYKSRGCRVRVVYGFDALETRMYSDFGELWRGWVKNTYAGFNFSPVKFVGGGLAVFAAFLLPFFILAYGTFSSGGLFNLFTVYGSFCSVVVMGAMAILHHKIGGSLKYTLLTPLAVTVYFAIMLVSFYKVTAGGGVGWKERKYNLKTMRKED